MENSRQVSSLALERARCRDETCVWCKLYIQIVFDPITCLGCSICSDRSYKTVKILLSDCDATFTLY
jgi:hypothetical protein